MIDLDELERLCREATPGPWAADAWNDHEADVHGFSISAGGCLLPLSNGTGELDEAEANASLIAALRNAAPKLIAMARRYQWLRNEAWYTSRAAPAVCMVDGAGRPFLCRETRYVEPILEGSSLDAAIDAAMQEQER